MLTYRAETWTRCAACDAAITPGQSVTETGHETVHTTCPDARPIGGSRSI